MPEIKGKFQKYISLLGAFRFCVEFLKNFFKYLFFWLHGRCCKWVCKAHQDIPGCFFTRTSLLKSSNNIEQMC